MSEVMAKIWARRIYAGTRTIKEVDERYGQAGHEAVREAYFELYGVDIDEEVA